MKPNHHVISNSQLTSIIIIVCYPKLHFVPQNNLHNFRGQSIVWLILQKTNRKFTNYGFRPAGLERTCGRQEFASRFFLQMTVGQKYLVEIHFHNKTYPYLLHIEISPGLCHPLLYFKSQWYELTRKLLQNI